MKKAMTPVIKRIRITLRKQVQNLAGAASHRLRLVISISLDLGRTAIFHHPICSAINLTAFLVDVLSLLFVQHLYVDDPHMMFTSEKYFLNSMPDRMATSVSPTRLSEKNNTRARAEIKFGIKH
jgi:hypothetical protein